MKIVFFNCAHNGDLFCIREIVEHIVYNNSNNHEFIMACLYSFSIFSDIKNLKIINYMDIVSYINNQEIQYFIHDNILYINTWAGAGFLCNDNNSI